MIIAITGCHGAGKTTVGTLVAQALRLPFHDEIGRRLASDPLLRPIGITAATACHAFDEHVFRAEIDRDIEWTGRARVVESWHPGNLAYAMVRNSEVGSRWLPELRRRASTRALVVQICASDEVLRARQSEPGPMAFFLEVARQTPGAASSLGLAEPIRVATDSESPRLVAERVVAALGEVVR